MRSFHGQTLLPVLGIALWLPVCGGGEESDEPALPPPLSDQELAMERARLRFVSFADFNKQVIARTCSPNPGVCHQSNNYPDLATLGSLEAAVMAPCNLEIPDPLMGWDGCERPADVLATQGFESELAWIEYEREGRWRIGLRVTPEFSAIRPARFANAAGDLLLDPPVDWLSTVHLTAGEPTARVTVTVEQPFILRVVESVLVNLVGGDPNRNGRWGGSDEAQVPGALVWPGDLDRSYLWGRLTGVLPGSRMPLANQPLSLDEYVALACWIQGLSEGDAVRGDAIIHYDGCEVPPVDLGGSEPAVP